MDDWQYRPAADHGLKPAERWKSLRRETGLTEHVTQSAWRLLVAAYLRIYHRLRIHGREHLPPQAPFILAANHSSHLDALILAAAVPWRLRQSVFPIAAGDVFFETPAVSVFSAMMLNALPMWRRRCGSHAMQELRDRLLGEPAIYILFPEGTRSRDGTTGKFKPGIGMLVAETIVPVIPCYLAGAHAAFPPAARLPRPLAIEVRMGGPLLFDDLANERGSWQEIAQRVEEAVGSLGVKN
jgi:1-acyl-sn-glycerol-3-phosphate acyltransferase